MSDDDGTVVGFDPKRKKQGRKGKAQANGESAESHGLIDFSSLQIGEKGPLKNVRNVVTVLRSVPEFVGAFCYDELRQDIVIDRDTPIGNKGPITDHTFLMLAVWLQENGLNVSTAIATEGLRADAMSRRFHPVQRYLRSLEWEGVPRLDEWLSSYAGVEKTEYSVSVGKKWLIASVARAMRPGCQSDSMLVFEGPQGRKKSTMLSILGGEWFSDSLSAVGTKDSAMEATRWWIIEVAELNALSKAESSAIKSFISRRHERYRLPYDRVVSDIPRSCVFAGTVNPSGGYLKDPTGNRRFWPVEVTGKMCLEALIKDRDQLFAEAMHEFRNGACWWLNEQEAPSVENEQEKRRDADAWEAEIQDFIATKVEVTMKEILNDCLQIDKGKWGRAEQTRIGFIMTSLGWRRVRRRIDDGDRAYKYVRPEPGTGE